MLSRAKTVTYPAVLLMLLSIGIASGTSPEWATLPEAVQRDGTLSLTYRAIRAAEESAQSLSSRDANVTFLAPDDVACEGIKELHAEPVDAAWATQFVLSHTFHGQINVLSTPSPLGRSIRLNVVSNGGSVRSVVDDGSITVTNLLGQERRISVIHGAIALDGRIRIRDNYFFVTKTGSIGVINDCAAP